MSRLFSFLVIASQLLSLVGISRVSAQNLEPTYADLVGIQQGTLSFLVSTFAGLQDLDELDKISVSG